MTTLYLRLLLLSSSFRPVRSPAENTLASETRPGRRSGEQHRWCGGERQQDGSWLGWLTPAGDCHFDDAAVTTLDARTVGECWRGGEGAERGKDRTEDQRINDGELEGLVGQL